MFERREQLSYRAAALMVLLCLLWGLQQVSIKAIIDDVSPIMQGGIRSVIAVALLTAWMRARNIRLLAADGTLPIGLLAGLMFAVEFILIYRGLAYTTASRAVIFIYTSPFFVALGVHLLVPHERLSALQIGGMLLAFSGVALAFGEGVTLLAGREWIGDLLALIGAAIWGATTVLIRATRLSSIAPSRTLFYQLLVSALMLPPASLAAGEPGVIELSALAVVCLLFQGVVVAFASYLTWFWLIAHYPASKLAAFTFLTPLFGVMAGVLLLSEPLSAGVLLALLFVGAGIYLVNRPAR